MLTVSPGIEKHMKLLYMYHYTNLNALMGILGKESITFKSLKNSYLSEINNLKNLNIITNVVSDIDGEYSVSYDFDLGTE